MFARKRAWADRFSFSVRHCASITLAVSISVLMLTTASSAFAQTPQQVRERCRAENRPCVGLVLSGGGARGFAHVGVIKVLEELGIRVDVIAGTSMGAMVGGAYAAGFSYEALRSTVLGVDWDKMLASRADRSILPFRRKLDDYKSLPASGIEIGVDGIPQLPESFVPSEELELFLNDKTGGVAMIEDLARLSIPFASTATDLVTGERVVMQKNCTLGQAMRASMSLPGVFAPVPYRKHLLVDGGLVDNLPVELARSMGADVLIVVNVGTPLAKRSELNSVVGVMAQMVNLLTEQNVRKSLASLTSADVLITPDLEGFTSADLKRSADIIKRGEVAARAAQATLMQFARPRKEFLAWNAARMAPLNQEAERRTHVLSDVRVASKRRAAVADERVLDVADVPVQKEVTNQDLDNAARRVWAEGNFDTVTYRFDPGPNGTEVLVFEPREKRRGYSSVRFGGSVQTDFDSGSSFNLLFAHSWNLLNNWGGEWRNEIQVGEERRFTSEFFQPLGAGSPWFLQPSVDYSRVPFDVYENGRPIARRRNETLQFDLMLGREIERFGYAGISTGWMRTKSTQEVGPSDSGDAFSAWYIGGEFLFDTLDNINFPTRGARFSMIGRATEGQSGNAGGEYYYTFDALVPYSINRWTMELNASVGRSTVSSAFSLGGARRLAGSPYGRWTGSRIEYGRLSLARDISGAFDALKQPIWIGVAAEAGRAWNPEAPSERESAQDDWHYAGSIYLGIDSLIGPLFLSYGRTFGDDSAFYFLWGRRD